MTNPRDRRPQDFLPLNQSVLHCLLVIGNEEMHGYAIMRAVGEKTAGRERILPGTLYASISRMVEAGLIEETEHAELEASGGPRRRYYRRTELGTAVARAEAERLRGLVELARFEKLLPESTP